MRVAIVGGGVLGTMHAWFGAQRGHTVIQLERELVARGASVRNFGLIWVGGRAEGAELDAALRARVLWEGIARRVPALGFRPAGSITVARTAAEVAVAERAMALPSASTRGFALLDPAEVRHHNAALRGAYLAGLFCARDGAVEPRTAQLALRQALLAQPGYSWLPGREVRDVGTGVVRDDHGDGHDVDAVIVCPGARLGGLVRELVPDIPVRPVRLQMMQTAPLGEPLPTAVADGDSFRYYPAYDADPLNEAQPQPAVARDHGMQLLMVQRADGGLTVGDTHEYEQPFGFDVEESPYEHLRTAARGILGRELPPTTRRWAGVYAQAVDRSLVAYRTRPADGVWVVTGPGGRGMTCSPAIAEQTWKEIEG